ncbi:ABC transporter substrate-binding protein [Tissierella pigra]|uniref:ABC transporter substrate-binding protein n=1 Tax=Tissierella pigra TaxID=2607614 RepID=A0A6N7Y111_9FIRM|nr:ABC transporter substrate-binding protein [Tissierella pigra]MBU5428263.1 ABC transporter substrate-binding protein [Tissierella pigra]MSU02425.1 ABC transporter substrate-binding protein [Tissierella pigra]
MKKYKNILWLMILAVITTSISGCTKTTGVGGLTNVQNTEKVDDTQLSITVEGDKYPLTVKDFLKKETILKEKPEKIAVLSGTPLNIWYDLGGKSVCTSDVSDNVKLIPEYREEIRNLPTIGPVYSIDMESVIPHKPDLIIAQVGTQSTQAKKLREMGFNVITTHIRGYDDVVSTYKAFGKILEKEELAETKIKELEKQKKEIVSKLPDESKSVVILYITSKTLAVKLDNSIAGDVAKILRLKNIASDLPPDTIGSETTPLDIEYIVEKNPDYVLVTSMISSNEEAIKSIEEEFNTNPVWSGVKAVQEGRVIHLPQEYFLYNAGPYYNEAIEYMAKNIYPEIYEEVNK